MKEWVHRLSADVDNSKKYPVNTDAHNWHLSPLFYCMTEWILINLQPCWVIQFEVLQSWSRMSKSMSLLIIITMFLIRTVDTNVGICKWVLWLGSYSTRRGFCHSELASHLCTYKYIMILYSPLHSVCIIHDFGVLCHEQGSAETLKKIIHRKVHKSKMKTLWWTWDGFSLLDSNMDAKFSTSSALASTEFSFDAECKEMMNSRQSLFWWHGVGDLCNC